MDEPEKRKVTRVRCRVPNGIQISLLEPRDDGTGFKQMRRVGDPVTLAGPRALGAEHVDPHSETEVDAEWWDAWLKQNAKNPLVLDGLVSPVEDDDKEPVDGGNRDV
jgi:hypothetical protein